MLRAAGTRKLKRGTCGTRKCVETGAGLVSRAANGKNRVTKLKKLKKKQKLLFFVLKIERAPSRWGDFKKRAKGEPREPEFAGDSRGADYCTVHVLCIVVVL